LILVRRNALGKNWLSRLYFSSTAYSIDSKIKVESPVIPTRDRLELIQERLSAGQILRGFIGPAPYGAPFPPQADRNKEQQCRSKSRFPPPFSFMPSG